MSPVDPQNIERDIAIIRERRGADAIHLGNEQSPVTKLPLPSPALMRITSGGIPLGRMTRLWGGPSTGKSLVAWMVIKSAHEFITERFPSGLEACYWNIEKQYDLLFTADRGVNIDRMYLEEVTIIEDVAREMQLLLGSIHLHVIDSCSTAIPQDRLNRDPGEWDMGLDAKVWMKSLDYIHNEMDKDENAIIYIDHESRDWHTQAAKAPGGREMEHASSLSMHFRKGRWLYYDHEGLLQTEDKLKEKGIMGIAGQKEADGTEVVVRTNKSRVCRPFRTAVLRMDLNTFEFDHTYELMEGALYFDINGGIAHRTGRPPIAAKTSEKSAWYEINDGIERPKPLKAQGDRALRLLIDADRELAEKIRSAMLAGN